MKSMTNTLNPQRFAVTLLALLITATGCDESAENPEFSEDELAEFELSEFEPDDAVPQSLTSRARHCVLQADEDWDSSDSASPEPVCFSHFPDAVMFATGEVIDPDMSPEEYHPMSLTSSQQTAATYVVGIEFSNTNYQGATLTLTSTSTCASGTKSYPTMPAGWDNVISSAKAYSGCNHSYHYANVSFGGALIDAFTASPNLGLLDNNTSSIRITQ